MLPTLKISNNLQLSTFEEHFISRRAICHGPNCPHTFVGFFGIFKVFTLFGIRIIKVEMFAGCIDYLMSEGSDFIFDDFNVSSCEPQKDTDEEYITTMTLKIDPDCVKDTTVGVQPF